MLDLLIPVQRLSTTGGVERFTWSVGAELAAAGHRVTFVAPRPRDGRIPAGSSLEALRLPAPETTVGTVLNMVTFGARATSAVRRLRRGRAVYYPLGAAFIPGLITAHSCHAAWIRDRRSRTGDQRVSVFDRLTILSERLTYRNRAIGITTVSPRCAEDIADCYGIDVERLQVVPPAVETEEFRTRTEGERLDARRRYRLADDRTVIGVVANYSFVRKRVGALIDAAAKLGATLLVAGEPDVDADDYRRLATHAGADVRFLGSVDDMRTFYASLDVYALPSINEAYGMAAHEAMAVGVATLVSDSCGIVGLFDDGDEAMVIDVERPGSLTDALAALCDESYRRPFELAGPRWAHRRGWDRVGQEVATRLTEGPYRR